MEVYTNPKDFISAQLVSTRDINAGPWNDWFTGDCIPAWLVELSGDAAFARTFIATRLQHMFAMRF
jgi:hypothetical protein